MLRAEEGNPAAAGAVGSDLVKHCTFVTGVRVVPPTRVDPAHAVDEGEGRAAAAEW
ncbi:ASCH domain-containing protein [Streptomyces luteogriseus]|uniref:hypothetical protein n=1 Tax=Streptomyces luteogriseus TaxID=68233 RepID=UPI0036C71D90